MALDKSADAEDGLGMDLGDAAFGELKSGGDF